MNEALGVRLRSARLADSDLLLRWANDPETRAASFHQAHIGRTEHRRWLSARLASPATTLWVAELDGVPIGQVRLEVEADGVADIGISLAPEFRGRGLGGRLLASALAEASRTLPVSEFQARVRPENARSLALFRAAGFGDPVAGSSADQPSVVLRLAVSGGASPGAARSPGQSPPRAPGSPPGGR